MCKVLLGMGADPNRQANDQSPLMIASHRNNFQIVELLVEYKADTRAINSQRLTALDYAILHGNYSIALFFVRSHRMMVVKDSKDYSALAKRQAVNYYVNYSSLLDCLSKQVDDFQIPNFFDEPEKETKESKQPNSRDSNVNMMIEVPLVS